MSLVRRRFAPIFILGAVSLLAACAGVDRRPAASSDSMQTIELAEDLQVRPLDERVWLHLSWMEMPGFGLVPSNGLVVFGADGALLVDTPWTPTQTHLLVEWIERTKGARLADVVVTHAHEDRTGGVAALPEGATIHARTATVELAAGYGRTFAAEELPAAASLQLAGGRVETFFPGAGHTPDNVVVWLPEQRLLFGGCFVKSAGARDLGNVADADLASWREAVRRVQELHPDAVVVVPGHGAVGGPELLAHTAALLDAVPEPAAAAP